MQGSRPDSREKYDFAFLLWAAAIIAAVATESLVLYSRVHQSGSNLRSLSFWYLPIMAAGPSGTAWDIYRRVAWVNSKEGNVDLPMWSYYLALFLFVANCTLFVFIASTFTR
jgi:hypothetical protein